MHIKLVTKIACVWSVLVPAFALAQPASVDTCVGWQQDMTVAMNARDWMVVERIARQRLARCDTGPELRALTWAGLGNALRGQGRHKEALDVADKCIEERYRAPACHINRLLLLVFFQRFDDARKQEAAARTVLLEKRKSLSSELATVRESNSKALDRQTRERVMATIQEQIQDVDEDLAFVADIAAKDIKPL
ncbi:MAG: hypothetical protein ACK54X_20380 [Burkholderiales bacterium]